MGVNASQKRDRAVQVTVFTDVAVNKLLFDPGNPRFGGKSESLTLPDIEKLQDRVQKLLEGDPHWALRLLESFKKNGFIRYEPLVVRQMEEKYVVIEGNRRLAAVRYIVENKEKSFPAEIVAKFKNIPVLIFHQQEDQSHIQAMRVYLGVRHLFGFKDWPAQSKATFLDDQIKTGDDLTRTVDELGITKSAVKRYLIPYRVIRKAKQHLKGISDQEFWTLGEALTRSAIPEYIELEVNPDTLEVEKFNLAKLRKLIDFLYGTVTVDGINRDFLTRKITDTRDSSKLAKVLSDSKAAAELERGLSLEEALLLVQTPSENIKRLRKQLGELALIIRSITAGGDKKSKDLKTKYQEFSRAARQFLKTNA
jgi:hypothetical protein